MAAEATQSNYRAFIAFSKADMQWADELQRSLDIVRVAPELVGRDTPCGPAPTDLKPMYHCGDGAPDGQGLTEEAAAALAESLFLVVLCSPDAAKSEHVNDAVRRFKLAGKRERIIPVIIGGESKDAAYPPALRFKLADDGALSFESQEPVAPLVIDARVEGDGRYLAVLKLSAALAGLDLNTYLQSEAAPVQPSPALPLSGLQSADAPPPVPPVESAVTGAPPLKPEALAAATPAMESVPEPRPPSVEEPAPTAKSAPVEEPPSPAKPPPVAELAPAAKQAAVEEPVPAVKPAFVGEQAPTPKPASAQEPARGQRRMRKPRSRRAARLVAALVLIAAIGGALAWLRYELPRNPTLLDGVLEAGTTGTVRVAEFAERLGLPRSVTLGFVRANESALRNIADWGPDIPALRYRKAMMLLAFARQDEVLGRSGAGRERITRATALLAGVTPDSRNANREREVALARVAAGADLLAQGAADEALKILRPTLPTLQRRVAAKPDATENQRDLSLAENAVGDAFLAKGLLDEALQRFRDALAIRERLVVLDPKNEVWRRDLSVSHERVGDVLMAKAELNDALKAYRTSLALRLTAVDPEASGGWQRQLAVAHNKIGDVLVARGALDEALNSYRAGLALQLAAPNRDDAARRDLAVSYERIGDVLRTQRAWDDALAAYRTSLEIRERLAASDPDNARWGRDLAVSHERIGDVMGRAANADALAAYRTSLALREKLAEKDRDNHALQRDIAISYNKIGDALAAQGKTEEALKSYRAGLAIRERLVALEPANPQLQWDLLVLQWRLASSGDDPATRFGLIVSTMRDLAAKRQLSVEQARWLPAAEQELARVRRN